MTGRETELRNEIATIREALAGLPDGGDQFAAKLVRSQMERRRDELEGQLSDALNRVLDLRFAAADDPHYSALPTSVLSVILGRLQSTLTFGTWASMAGPYVDGTPPASVERASRTEVVALPHGSFRVVVRKQELELAPEFDLCVATILDLAAAASTQSFDDELGAKAQALGAQGCRRLELLFRKVAEERLGTDLTWSSPSETREVFVSRDAAAVLSDWLAQVTPEVEDLTVRGYLRRADTLTGSFKVEAEASGQMYEGRGEPDVLAHSEMDALYEARIRHEVLTAPHSGRRTERFTLLRLSPP